MNRILTILLVTVAVIIYLLWRRPNSTTSAAPQPPQVTQEKTAPVETVAATPAEQQSAARPNSESDLEDAPVTDDDKKPKKTVLHYKMQNGLMIVQGDLVAGVPMRPDAPETGMVEMRPLKLWPKGVAIPYHIQPDLTNPERVQQALTMFAGTAVHFTPYNGETDVLVFEPGEGNCLSYVGKIGGKQPIWISPRCAPEDIAHEILHTLGFVHEQNRVDRDDFVNVLFDNIVEEQSMNFEKLPQEFMKVSGLGEFDFRSLMIYPVWMFAKNGQSTMEPKIPDKLIQPEPRLSPGDINKLNRAYGN